MGGGGGGGGGYGGGIRAEMWLVSPAFCQVGGRVCKNLNLSNFSDHSEKSAKVHMLSHP